MSSNMHNIWRLYKGQLRSDFFFLFSILPKNEQKTSVKAKFCKDFVCFLEELGTRKIASEIIWPLVSYLLFWISFFGEEKFQFAAF